MRGLIESRLQKLEQIRQNLLYTASGKDDLVKTIKIIALEIVVACKEALRKVWESLNSWKKETEG